MAALASLLIGCETVVDINIPEEPPRLVLNAFLQADSAVVVELTESRSILTNDFLPAVSGALVTLLEEEQPVATLEESDRTGIYFSSFTPSIGKSYTLRVNKVGFEPVEGTTVIPAPMVVRAVMADTVTMDRRFSSDPHDAKATFSLGEVRIMLDDPGNERNYYGVSAYHYERGFKGERNSRGDYVITDTVRTVRSLYFSSDDPATASIVDEFAGGGETSSNIISFSDEFFNGKTYSLRLTQNVLSNWDAAYTQLHLVLHATDEAQYRYFRAVQLQYENQDNPFAEPVQVYSNVENGFGIVAGSSVSRVVMELK